LIKVSLVLLCQIRASLVSSSPTLIRATPFSFNDMSTNYV